MAGLREAIGSGRRRDLGREGRGVASRAIHIAKSKGVRRADAMALPKIKPAKQAPPAAGVPLQATAPTAGVRLHALPAGPRRGMNERIFGGVPKQENG